jgi:signal transduction histidine kinase
MTYAIVRNYELEITGRFAADRNPPRPEYKRERLAELGLNTSKVIHEIANHLNGISTSVQVVKYQMTQQEDCDATLKTIDDLVCQLKNLQDLLQELRDFGRPLKLNCEPLSLAALAGEVISQALPAMATQSVESKQNFPDSLPPVLADQKKLKQVLINLVKNATEAMPKGGLLTLRGYEEAGHICIETQDTGIGIPEDVRVFDPFATSKPEGMGLGLPIARDIITAHHGTIEYVSELGNGTTFKISLPAATITGGAAVET